MPPPSLRRQECLSGSALVDALHLKSDGSIREGTTNDLIKAAAMARGANGGGLISVTPDSLSEVSAQDGLDSASNAIANGAKRSIHRELTPFERTIFFYPPMLESLLAFLPTASIVDLYHTSGFLRDFLGQYPLAWKTLSFRGPPPLLSNGIGTPPVNQDFVERAEQLRKTHALTSFLVTVVVPHGSRLTSLDLCNTAVDGMALTNHVLGTRKQTLRHLSVRNCKNVSVKYHIVPWLQLQNPKTFPFAEPIALKSLYTYRCRHHRRRPYFPNHLARRDSDSEPTHELIELCHILGIWTDTAWCPTPGGRCYRRKEYHSGRAAPNNAEVWVPFDRLWRSSNRVGTSNEDEPHQYDGRLWEEEAGYNGEPLGYNDGSRDGKDVPTHLRKSYRTFVDNIECDSCGDLIDERCEQCSINMHCIGCRKTLCASCAFDRPLPRKRRDPYEFLNQAFGRDRAYSMMHPGLSQSSSAHGYLSSKGSVRRPPKFWWAPGARRSPNLMIEVLHETSDSESDDDTGEINVIPALLNRQPPKLNMHWCCIEPCFSGGGGLAIIGSGNTGGQGADRIRTAPLPKEKRYEDRDFQARLRSPADIHRLKDHSLYEHILMEDVDIVPYLQQDNIELQARTCPRNLCQTCYRTFHWRVACRSCRKPLCKEHDFRGLKLRKCGYRDLHVEREHLQTTPPTTQLQIPPYRSKKAGKAPMRNLPAPPPLKHSLPNKSSEASSSNRILSSNRTLKNGAADLSSSTILQPSPSGTPGAGRPRASSLSELRPRLSSPHATNNPTNQSFTTPETVKILSLPGKPKNPVQWQGCGAYFCQRTRGVGDPRPMCRADMRECADCRVLVCEFCLHDNPTCPCNECTKTFYCPVCRLKPGPIARCRRDQDLAAQAATERQRREKMLLEIEMRRRADEVIENVRDFFAAAALAAGEDPSDFLEPRDERHRDIGSMSFGSSTSMFQELSGGGSSSAGPSNRNTELLEPDEVFEQLAAEDAEALGEAEELIEAVSELVAGSSD